MQNDIIKVYQNLPGESLINTKHRITLKDMHLIVIIFSWWYLLFFLIKFSKRFHCKSLHLAECLHTLRSYLLLWIRSRIYIFHIIYLFILCSTSWCPLQFSHKTMLGLSHPQLFVGWLMVFLCCVCLCIVVFNTSWLDM